MSTSPKTDGQSPSAAAKRDRDSTHDLVRDSNDSNVIMSQSTPNHTPSKDGPTPGSPKERKSVIITNSDAYVCPTETITAIQELGNTESHVHDLKLLISMAQSPHLHSNDSEEVYDEHIRLFLKDAIFVGHINTDLDSVAGAIGAASLFNGTPATSEDELNGEIQFALKECNVERPMRFDLIPGAHPHDPAYQNGKLRKICLVDHSEVKQMTKLLRDDPKRGERISGIIDHHCLAESFYTSKPLYMDLRPWGSMSTIVTVLFLQHKRFLPPTLAKLLLMAILSDTLNLQSVTTTAADRQVVVLLTSYASVTDPDNLARRQFQAKTDYIVQLGSYEMVRGDQKDFSVTVPNMPGELTWKWKAGLSVLEVTDVDAVLKCAFEIMMELRILKKEKGLVNDPNKPNIKGGEKIKIRNRREELDFAFLFVVDIVNQKSYLIISGGRELALAKKAFGDLEGTYIKRALPFEQMPEAPGSTINPEQTLMVLPDGLVSRKAQFAPAILSALGDETFECHKKPNSAMTEEQLEKLLEEELKILHEHGERNMSRITNSKGQAMNGENGLNGNNHGNSDSTIASEVDNKHGDAFSEALFLQSRQDGFEHDSVKVIRKTAFLQGGNSANSPQMNSKSYSESAGPTDQQPPPLNFIANSESDNSPTKSNAGYSDITPSTNNTIPESPKIKDAAMIEGQNMAISTMMSEFKKEKESGK